MINRNKVKKVALINPGKDERYAVQEPLNLGFIASYLEKKGIEVTIIDELAGQDVNKELDKYCPDIAGITATTPLAPDAYRIADMCKQMRILTVMGGVHASVLPEESLEHVDIVVKGEGEIAMYDIARNGVKSGIVSRPYIKNIQQIPPPARHLMQMEFYLHTKDRLPGTYLHFVPPHTKTTSILTSRGCPYSCIFCHNSWQGLPYRFNSPDRVVSEIRDLIETYGIQALFFIEDNFFANRTRVKKICELIEQEGFNIIWGANARVDNVDLEILQIVRQAGCRQVTFGFESGSQRILDVLNKKTTVEQNKTAIELCNKAGIIPQGTVMIGNPTETIEDVKATQQFLRQSDIKSVGVCITTPYPGSVLWDWCRQCNLIPEQFNWSDFNYDRVPIPACNTMSPEQIKRLQADTCKIIGEKQPLGFLELLHKSLVNPGRVVRTLKEPSKLATIIKRLAGSRNNKKAHMEGLRRLYGRFKRLMVLLKNKGVKHTYNRLHFYIFWSWIRKHQLLIKLLNHLAPYPRYLEIEVTTKCNLKCIMCEHTYWSEPNRDMSFEQFKDIVDQFGNLKWIGLTGIGESFINKDFMKMLRYVKSKSVLVELYDTFYFLNERIAKELIEMGVDRILASVDAATKQTYEKIRVGSDFERVINNVRNLVRLKKKMKASFPQLDFHYIITKANFRQIPQYIELVHSLTNGENASIQFTRMLHKFDQAEDLYMEIPEEITHRAKCKAEQLGVGLVWNADTPQVKPTIARCIEWTMPFIFVTGDVIPCCSGNEAGQRDFQKRTALGNVFETSFKQIWHGQKYKDLRRMLRRGQVPQPCSNCCLYDAGGRDCSSIQV